MRPIGWGLLVFIASGMVWFISSITAGMSLVMGEPALEMPIVHISGGIFFLSLPVAIVAELIRWYRKRKEAS